MSCTSSLEYQKALITSNTQHCKADTDPIDKFFASNSHAANSPSRDLKNSEDINQATIIRKSILSEIIKYKKFTRGCARTFSKKSSGNSSSRMSQHGVDDSTNFSTSQICG